MSHRPVAIVIRLSALGDVLLASPAIRQLAITCDVVVVTDPPYAPLVECFPGVTAVRSLERAKGVAGARRLGVELRALKPALVVDLQNKVRTRVLVQAVGVTSKRLVRRTVTQAMGAIFGNDTILNDRHQTERYLAVLDDAAITVGRLGPLVLKDEWRLAADRVSQEAGWTPDDRPFAVAPAATHATKGYGVDRYAELVRREAAPGSPLLLIAGPRDGESVRLFREALGEWPRLVDCSHLPLTTMAALLARSRTLIGNDSGPIHLASALDVPTVAVFGPTSVRRWGPVPGTEDRHRVARLNLTCSPCSNHGQKQCPLGHHECLKGLSVDAVERELRALIMKGVGT